MDHWTHCDLGRVLLVLAVVLAGSLLVASFSFSLLDSVYLFTLLPLFIPVVIKASVPVLNWSMKNMQVHSRCLWHGPCVDTGKCFVHYSVNRVTCFHECLHECSLLSSVSRRVSLAQMSLHVSLWPLKRSLSFFFAFFSRFLESTLAAKSEFKVYKVQTLAQL